MIFEESSDVQQSGTRVLGRGLCGVRRILYTRNLYLPAGSHALRRDVRGQMEL